MSGVTLLVPYSKDDASACLLRLACRIAAAEGGRVVVLALTEVHRALSLAGLPAHFDTKAWYALSDAEEVAGGSDAEVELELRRTHHKAKTIIREAQSTRADAILLPVPRRRHVRIPTWPDRTQQYVSKHATCPVITGHFSALPPRPAWDVLTEVQHILDHAS